MAARKHIAVDENTRKKIQATQLIKRLTDHVLTDLELTSTQVTAALGLLKKTLPDLSSVDMSGEIDQTITVVRKEYKPSN